MISPVKRRVRSLLRKLDLDLYKSSGIPFGFRWEYDLSYLLGNRDSQLLFIDVGANIGQTALRMKKSFPGARIYSFEPVQETFDKLRQNTAHLPGIECVNSALSDAPGEAMMTTDRNGKNTLASEVISSRRAKVRLDTLDNFCAEREIEHIDLLKIDTEGHETFVLAGASSLFEQGRVDFVLAECDFSRRPQQPHGDFFELHQKLDAQGFRIVSFYTGGVDSRGWLWGDVLMVHEGVTDGIPAGWAVSPHSPAPYPYPEKTPPETDE